MSAIAAENVQNSLHVARYSLNSTVLGPGRRGVLWLQGCLQNCPGCVSPENRPLDGGGRLAIAELVEIFANCEGLEGLTFSGGEPMLQAEGLVELILELNKIRTFTWFCYTGYLYEDLRSHGTPAQRKLLDLLDILVDGPYVEARHRDLLWRGSDNQRVWFLTPRYEGWREKVDGPGQGLEFEFDERGVPQWMGIPPMGFRERFLSAMRERGILILSSAEGLVK